MKTVVIQIGNSDNGLTQHEWAHFIAQMQEVVSANTFRIHFRGGSAWDSMFQNACWVCEILDQQIDSLKNAVTLCRISHKQKSAAITFGDTELV